jgi:hypothetical protein
MKQTEDKVPVGHDEKGNVIYEDVVYQERCSVCKGIMYTMFLRNGKYTFCLDCNTDWGDWVKVALERKETLTIGPSYHFGKKGREFVDKMVFGGPR